MLNVYLAGRYSRREELVGYANQLVDAGFTVTSTWLNGHHDYKEQYDLSSATHVEAMRKFATEDIDDVKRADVLIAFTEEPRKTATRGGRHVEFGYALGMGKNVIVVGPLENVFYATIFPQMHANAWGMSVIGMLNVINDALARKRFNKPSVATTQHYVEGMYCSDCGQVLIWIGECRDVECAGMCNPPCGGYALKCKCKTWGYR